MTEIEGVRSPEEHRVKQEEQWYVALKREKPPAIGDWVAIDEDRENVQFAFVDGTESEGFTVFEGSEGVPSWLDRKERVARGEIPWLHFSDCMEVVGIQPLKWRPENWSSDDPLWLLTVESLPSNIEFEKRIWEEYQRQRKNRPITEKISDWWNSR